MRLSQTPSALFSSAALLLAYYSRPSWAASDGAEIVLDSDNADLRLPNSTFAKRWGACPNGACGVAQTYCCNTNAGSSCYTDANSVATCLSGAAPTTTPAATLAVTTAQNGYYTYWTSTTVDTETKIYVYSSWVPLTTQVQVQSCPLDWAGMTTLCGGLCCSSNQYCNAGTCTTNANVYTVTEATATAGTRVTSITGVIVTSTISPTVTTAFGTPVPAASGNATLVAASTSGGLSGGAIAGIVIGVIAGIILLLFICLICCLKAGIDTILALFGLRNRRKRRGRVVEEEEVIRTRRRAGTADTRRWYGDDYESRPPRRDTTVIRTEERRRRTDGLGGLAGVGAGLAGLWIALGMKRRADERRRRQEDKSETESSYFGSSYYNSASGSSDSRSNVRREVRRETIRRDSRR